MALTPDLSQHTILITGAGRGLGRSMALRLAVCGATLGIVDVDAAACEAVSAEIVADGGQALALPADVADREALLAVAAQLAAHTGRIDVVINNAAALRAAGGHQRRDTDAHDGHRHQRHDVGRAGAAAALRSAARRQHHQHGLTGG